MYTQSVLLVYCYYLFILQKNAGLQSYVYIQICTHEKFDEGFVTLREALFLLLIYFFSSLFCF